MASKHLVDGLNISQLTLNGKCEDCILGRQTRRPFDRETEKNVAPLDLVAFDLWGPSHTQSAGRKVYLMIVVDAGTSYKWGAYLSDKSDHITLAAFENFRTRAETTTGKKVHKLRTDGAFGSAAWEDYCQKHGITHEFTAPHSSAQNGLAERAIQTTMDDVRTLLRDSDLSHSYWAEAAAYSIDTRNLIPSRRHPDQIPLESFSGKRQNIAHLRVFGAKCWAKIPTNHGVQVTGGSKLDPKSVECRLLGYASGGGNYKVQDIASRRVFVSRDVVFEEGRPRRTLASVGEQQIPIFDITSPLANVHPDHHLDKPADPINDGQHPDPGVNQGTVQVPAIPEELCRSARAPLPSQTGSQSMEYCQREATGKGEGQDWATDNKRPQASANPLG
jgi:transposase InsO family protein